MDTTTLPSEEFTPMRLFICFIGLLAITFSIVLRMEPQAIGSDVLSQLQVSMQNLEEINIKYKYSLLCALLGAGILIDWFGPRVILALALIAAMLGNYLFCMHQSLYLILLGRAIIIHAHPFILISVLTIGSFGLPKRHFPFYVGIIFALLLKAPEVIKPYLAQITDLDGVRTGLYIINTIGCVILGFLLVSAGSRMVTYPRRYPFSDIIQTLRNSKIWLASTVSMLGWIPNTFLLNYGGYYLVNNFNFSANDALDTVNIAFSCFALGSLIIGAFTDIMVKKRYLIVIGYFIAAFSFSVMLYMPHLSVITVPTLLFITGFFSGTALICYSKITDFSTPATTGFALGMLVFLTTLGNILAARFIGGMLEQYVTTPTASTATAWHLILAIIPVALFIGGLIASSLRKPSVMLIG